MNTVLWAGVVIVASNVVVCSFPRQVADVLELTGPRFMGSLTSRLVTPRFIRNVAIAGIGVGLIVVILAF